MRQTSRVVLAVPLVGNFVVSQVAISKDIKDFVSRAKFAQDWADSIRCGTSITTLDGKIRSQVGGVYILDENGNKLSLCASPLNFSPDGKRLSLKGGDGQIYLAEEGDWTPICITRNLSKKQDGRPTWANNHDAVSWSPASDRIAVLTNIADSALISVYQGDSLRTVFTYKIGDRFTDPKVVWSRDETALFAGLDLERTHWQLVQVPLGAAGPTIIFDAPEEIGAMAWSPNQETLSFSVGPSLYLYQGMNPKKVFTAHWPIDGITWSPDGERLALQGIWDLMSIISQDGSDSWNVGDGNRHGTFDSDIVWLNASQFAVLISKQGRAHLYEGDVSKQRLVMVPTGDIACAPLVKSPEGVLYFKVVSHDEWQEVPRGASALSGGYRVRGVDLNLYLWDFREGKAVRLNKSTFGAGQIEGEPPMCSPVFWIPGS